MALLIRVALVAGALALLGSAAADFLTAAQQVTRQQLEARILSMLTDAAGPNDSATKGRISDVEGQLRPMTAVMPKNQDGTLSRNVVRYMLHRFFAKHHGWFIRGLEPGSESREQNVTLAKTFPASTAVAVMQEWVPSYLQSFLETIVKGRGVNLHEVAAFAATLEDLVHTEENGYLRKVYHALQIPIHEDVDEKMEETILQTYMMVYSVGGNFSFDNREEVNLLLRHWKDTMANWPDTLALVHRVWQNYLAAHNGSSLGFNASAQIVRTLGDQFGAVNDVDCGRLKKELLSMESQKPGRIRLVDYYKRGLSGTWEFNEKIEYLRVLGTIDETDPSTPLIIVPNYVSSRSNCLPASSFYAVCCRNACEDIMERLETEIVSSSARPSRISKLISKLPSESVTAPRTLSVVLMQRLHEIADKHGGQVPLHGRLFAQWMHHAYPRECPLPHEVGAFSPQTPNEWMQNTGQGDTKATKEEMLWRVSEDSCKLLPNGVQCGNAANAGASLAAKDEELPWNPTEELLIVRQEASNQGAHFFPVRYLAVFILLSFVLRSVVWRARFGKSGKPWSFWAGFSLSSASAKSGKCYNV